MIDRLRPIVAPAYLFLCLLAGGSAQGIWANAALRLAAIGIIAWALITRREEPLPRPIKQLLAVVAMTLALVGLQLVPLPASTWAALPGREPLAEGFRLLGIAPRSLPLSLGPYDSVETLLALLPPLGMLAAMIGLRGYSDSWLAAALIGGTVAGVLLGILQVASANPTASPWYLYRYSNFGVATGFFANSNHMANLLLVTMPFIAAVGSKLREGSKDLRARAAGLALASSGLVVTVLGLILNRSLAGYGLGVPILLASLIILFGLPRRLTRTGLIAVGVAGIVAVALIWTRPIGSNFERLGAETSLISRQQIAANSLRLTAEFMPVGSGLGTFAKVYPRSEDANAVDQFYVNHAHNDYLELALEMGAPGILLILLFLAWWAAIVVQMLRSSASDQYAMAAAIASAAILFHSAVDYPLRTAAIGAVMAMCLVMIIQSRRSASGVSDLRPARHIVVG